eukprot:TCALIF_06316-PA protein Name:"Protein of unknown function" AED:0.28 eAED:0.28 QI:17/0.5/0/0.66/0/0/3/0/239
MSCHFGWRNPKMAQKYLDDSKPSRKRVAHFIIVEISGHKAIVPRIGMNQKSSETLLSISNECQCPPKLSRPMQDEMCASLPTVLSSNTLPPNALPPIASQPTAPQPNAPPPNVQFGSQLRSHIGLSFIPGQISGAKLPAQFNRVCSAKSKELLMVGFFNKMPVSREATEAKMTQEPQLPWFLTPVNLLVGVWNSAGGVSPDLMRPSKYRIEGSSKVIPWGLKPVLIAASTLKPGKKDQL